MTDCPACGEPGAEPFYEQRGVPVNSWRCCATREEALAFPRGDLVLAFCRSCGFVFNTAFDSAQPEYSRATRRRRGSRRASARSRAQLAEQLVERYDLRGKDVLEIGCGKGEFLVEICELGGNRGIGIDPGWTPGRLDVPAGVEFVRAPYDARAGSAGG